MTDSAAPQISIKSALKNASQQLQKSNEVDHRLEAEILLCHVLAKDRSWLYAWSDQKIPQKDYLHYLSLINRRKNGEPISHITGYREFWNLSLKITPDTLIPRHETELVVETILSLLTDKPLKLLELGTGSGAISAAIASERPQWQITATDKSISALAVAEYNFKNLNLPIKTIHSDWFEDLRQNRFDVIVSNPPYIADNDPHLQLGDLRFEPESALKSGNNGLKDIEIIILQSPDFLNSNGLLILEHGYDQGESIRKLMSQHQFHDPKTLQDLAGCDRVTFATAH